MEKYNRFGNHTLTRLSVYIVWVAKYRYSVSTGDIQKRARELIIQMCDAENVEILGGVVSNEHIHLHIENILQRWRSQIL